MSHSATLRSIPNLKHFTTCIRNTFNKINVAACHKQGSIIITEDCRLRATLLWMMPVIATVTMNTSQMSHNQNVSLGRYEGKNKIKRTTTTSKVEPPLATNAQSRAKVKLKKPATKASPASDSKKNTSKTQCATKSSSAKSSKKIPAKN